MKVYVFPGQGSQSIGMGKGLFDEYKDYIDRADEILGYSTQKLCLEDPQRVLSKTEFTQPSLYIVNALHYLKHTQEGAEKADYLAGHSLGEYNALFAAGAFSFETGLQLVKKRGELMSKVSGGGMAAVLGVDYSEIKKILCSNALDAIDIANYNSVTQTVLSGPVEELKKLEVILEDNDIMFIPLPVSAPFHSRYMKEVVNEYESFLNKFTFNTLKTPVISNISARPYENNEIVYNLKEQLSSSVQWLETIRYLRSKGEFQFKELGPGNVLEKLIKNIAIGK
ncbi:MAG: [acyl-carrier-protein] S-malonyltransferase [Gammaproteobacteria bacterium]|nr:MAG: [acyl-carrier-protein] S-malonyltransferase [Gammaproteobacteria bacterium]